MVMTQKVTTLEELLPLLRDVETAKQFGAVVIANVPTKPRGLRRRLALAARDALGLAWTDATVRGWCAPYAHTAKRAEGNRAACAEWQAENRERQREAKAAWRAVPQNRERNRKLSRKWRVENRERKNAYQNAYKRDRRTSDPAFALRHATSTRIYNALRDAVAGTRKYARALELLGCSAQEYVEYLEDLFEPGMTWENWTTDGWHVDHVIPVAGFDLATEEGQRAAFHFTNTRPMWAEENLSKGASHYGRRWTHADHV